ncbi:MAG: flagellar hook-length control protein FliK [Planctomycetes bacterium]|nr:flagellar hook-length control protein FliK [Planctomycetota bacterium]
MIQPSPSARIEMLPGRPAAVSQARNDQPQAAGKGFAELLASLNKAQVDPRSGREKRAENDGRSGGREDVSAGRRASSRKSEELKKEGRLPARERPEPAKASEDPEAGPGAATAAGPRRGGEKGEPRLGRGRQPAGDASEASLAVEPRAGEREVSSAPQTSGPGGPMGLDELLATGDQARLEPREVEAEAGNERSARAGEDGELPAREMEAAASTGGMEFLSLNGWDAAMPGGSPLRNSWAQGAGVPEVWLEGSPSSAAGAGWSLSSLAEWNGGGPGALVYSSADSSNVEDSWLPGSLQAPPGDSNSPEGGSGQELAWKDTFDLSRDSGDAGSFSNQETLAGLLEKKGRSPAGSKTGGAGLLSSSSAPAASEAMEPPVLQPEIPEALPRRDPKGGYAGSRGAGEAVVLESPAPPRPASSGAPAPAKAPADEVTLDPGRDSFEQQVSQLILSRIRQGESQMRILLRPPHLGQLHVHLTLRGSALDLAFKVESKPVRELLQSRHQELQRALSAGGVEMEKFHVQLIGSDDSRQRGGSLAGEGGGSSGRAGRPDQDVPPAAPAPPSVEEAEGGESLVHRIDKVI